MVIKNMFETIEEIIKQKESWKLQNEIRCLEIELEVNKKQNNKNFRKFLQDTYYEHRVEIEERDRRIIELEVKLSEFDLDSENAVRTIELENILDEDSKIFKIVSEIINREEPDWEAMAVH
jgi:hypothetical protein